MSSFLSEDSKNNIIIGFDTITYKILIYFLLFIFSIFFLWSCLGTMLVTKVVPAIIRTEENISIITCINSGKLIEKNFSKGQVVQKDSLLYSFDTEQLEKKLFELEDEKNKITIGISNLKRYRETIISGKNNLTSEDGSLFYKASLFFLEEKELSIILKQTEDKYKSLEYMYPSQISKKELEAGKDELMLAQINYDKYLPENIVKIDDELNTMQTQMKQIIEEITDTSYVIKSQSIKSPITGIIEDTMELNIGDFIFSGEQLAKIIPIAENNIRVELSIPSEIIQKVQIGQRVILEIKGLSNKQKDTINGKISFISSEVLTSPEGEHFFNGEVLLSKQEIINNFGEDITIKSGMPINAKIILNETRIITYLLAKIGLTNNNMY